MAAKTGRKTPASPETRNRAVEIKKKNPSMSNAQIAERLNVSTRQVQYWLKSARDRGEL